MTDKLIQLLTDTQKIDTGLDSSVYKSNWGDYVIKVYNGLRKVHLSQTDLENCLELVEKYNSATLKAKDLMDLLWNTSLDTNRIAINNKLYRVNITIVPQGKPFIIENQVVSIGQQYIPYANLNRIFIYKSIYPPDMTKPTLDFYKEIVKQRQNIEQIIYSVNKLIVDTVNVPFNIVSLNVKPNLDKSKNVFNLIITDIASSITGSYASIDKSYRQLKI